MSLTELRILGWKAEGLRCPDHELSFARDGSDSVYPVTLIQMPNGTGKTTTLQLLRAALSGNIEGGWTQARVRGFRKSPSTTNGVFRLVLHRAIGRVTVSMEFDFGQGMVQYKTTHGSGIQDGFRPPRDLKNLLLPDVVGCFVFDGELAHRLLDHEHTNAEMVVEHLFQLRMFDNAISAVEEYWEKATAQNGAKEKKGYTQRKNQVDVIRGRLHELRREQGSKQLSLATAEEELRSVKKQFDEQLVRQHHVREQLQGAEALLAEAEDRVSGSVQSVLSAMHDPHALCETFAMDMLELKKHLDRVKLPEHSAREFFIELAEEIDCVCGRPHNEETRAAVRTQSAKYLGTEAVAFLNAMKSDIAAHIGDDFGSSSREMRQHIAALECAMRDSYECRTHRDEIRAQGVSNDPDLPEKERKIKYLEMKIRDLRTDLARYNDPTESAGHSDTYGIKVLEQRLKRAEAKLAEISNTIAMKAKRDVLTSILRAAHSAARAGIGQDIASQTNERILELMPHNKIRVKEVRKCIVLDGQDGGSVGETLSVAYAFLATLFNRSEHVLPFVVDSPANPIDLLVRERVAELIPSLGKQFIAFTISSERQQFLAPLERKAGGGVQYLTIFRRGAAPLDGADAADVVETMDAFCVHGRQFFHRFHLDKEVNGGI